MRFGAIANSAKGPPPIGDRVKEYEENGKLLNLLKTGELTHLFSIYMCFFLSNITDRV